MADMNEIDIEERIQLKASFEHATKLIEVSNIDDPNKRLFHDLLSEVQSNLARDGDSADINNGLIMLEILSGVAENSLKNQELAATDLLTDLPNRRSFEDAGRRSIAQISRGDTGTAAVIFADVVKFKDFNTNYGHNVGDVALVEIANTLKSCLRDTDIVARYAGDEFTALLKHKDEKHDFDSVPQNVMEAFKDAHINVHLIEVCNVQENSREDIEAIREKLNVQISGYGVTASVKEDEQSGETSIIATKHDDGSEFNKDQILKTISETLNGNNTAHSSVEYSYDHVPLGLSAGMSYLQPHDSLEGAVQRADASMYAAKAAQHRELAMQNNSPDNTSEYSEPE